MGLKSKRKSQFCQWRLHIAVARSSQSLPFSRLNTTCSLSLSSQDKCPLLDSLHQYLDCWGPEWSKTGHKYFQMKVTTEFKISSTCLNQHQLHSHWYTPGCTQLSSLPANTALSCLPSANRDTPPPGLCQPRPAEVKLVTSNTCTHLRSSGHSHHGHYRRSKP